MLRITKVILWVRMIEKLTLLFVVLLGGTLSVAAQSGLTQPRLDSSDNIAMATTKTRSLSSEEYACTLSSPVPLTTQQVPTGSFAVHRQEASLLLHLKNNHNQVILQVTNPVGNIVQASPKVVFSDGFYELPILDKPVGPGIYFVKLVVNEQVVTFRTVK